MTTDTIEALDLVRGSGNVFRDLGQPEPDLEAILQRWKARFFMPVTAHRFGGTPNIVREINQG
jgi:hypothetical protein